MYIPLLPSTLAYPVPDHSCTPQRNMTMHTLMAAATHRAAPGVMVCLEVAWSLDVLFYPRNQFLQLLYPGGCLGSVQLAG